MSETEALATTGAEQARATPGSSPFTSLLLEDDQARGVALLRLLQSMVGSDTRVVHVGNPLRSPLTLERILIQVAGPEGEVFLEDDARLIVRAIAERQGQEACVVLLIEQAETLHPKVLRSLQAMTPYFALEGCPTLQVVFVGRPSFRALLDEDGLQPLRQALGFERPGPAEPDATAIPGVPERPGKAPGDKALGAKASIFRPGQRTVSVARPEPKPDIGLDRLPDPSFPFYEPADDEPPTPTPNAAERLAVRAEPGGDLSPRRRGALLPALLTLVVLAALATGAFFGLRSVFYRDVPARPALASLRPAEPQSPATVPLAAPPQPSPPQSSPATPPPKAVAPALTTAAPPPATPPAAIEPDSTPSSPPTLPSVITPPSVANSPARLRREFDAFLLNSGLGAATLSEAQRGALFDEFLAWRARNASTPPAAAPAPATAEPPPRVVIHVPAGSTDAEAVSKGLVADLRPRPGMVETREVADTPGRPTIRYYHPEDESLAWDTATRMKGSGLSWAVQDFSTFRPSPSRGTIEVWLPR